MNQRFDYASPKLFARLILLLCISWCGGRLAFAVPPPLDEAQRLAEADLVVEGRVLSVENTGQANMRARIRIDQTIKGRAPENPLIYSWVPPEPGLLGPMDHNVFAGQQVRLFLIFERGQYVPWATNSVEFLLNTPENLRALPQKRGEIIYAPGEEPHRACSQFDVRPARRCRFGSRR